MEAVETQIPIQEEIKIQLPGKIKSYEDWKFDLTSHEKTIKGDDFSFYTEYVFTEFLRGCGVVAEQTPDEEDAPGGGDTRVWLPNHERFLYFDTKLGKKLDLNHQWTSKYCVNIHFGVNTVKKIASGHRETQKKLLDEVMRIEYEFDSNQNMKMIRERVATLQ